MIEDPNLLDPSVLTAEEELEQPEEVPEDLADEAVPAEDPGPEGEPAEYGVPEDDGE